MTRFVEGREIPPGRCASAGRASTRPPSRCAASTRGLRFPAVSTPSASSRRTARRPSATESRSRTTTPGRRSRPTRSSAARAGADLVPCHNDLLNANFILEGERLWLVDWEYAGMGDRFFDLANFSINHELDDDENAALLEAYFGERTGRGRARAPAHALHVGLPRGDVGRRPAGRSPSSTSTSWPTQASTSSGCGGRRPSPRSGRARLARRPAEAGGAERRRGRQRPRARDPPGPARLRPRSAAAAVAGGAARATCERSRVDQDDRRAAVRDDERRAAARRAEAAESPPIAQRARGGRCSGRVRSTVSSAWTNGCRRRRRRACRPSVRRGWTRA